MLKKILSLFTATCLIIAMTPSVAFAAEQPDNMTGETVALLEAGDTMSNNHGTITDNQGNIINNYGTVTTNTSTGTITTNRGAVITNHGTVQDHFGEITTNYGTIVNNLCGTVNDNQGTIVNDYKYVIDTSSCSNMDLTSDTPNDVLNLGNSVYVKAGASVILVPNSGYQFDEDNAPAIIGSSGTVTNNNDGTYTISGITSNITLSATTVHIPVEDIHGIPSTMDVAETIYLNDFAIIEPSNLDYYAYWEVADAGTTGAVITEPYSGTLSATSVGTIVVKATVNNGAENGEPYTKEFSITVVNHVQPVYDAYIALQNALEGSDLELLREAAEGFSSILDIYNNLTDSQKDALGALLNMSADDAFSIILNDWVDTNLILSVADACDAFSTNPNKDTATEFVNLFESIINEPAYEGTAELIRKFIPDVDDIYSDAKSFLDNSSPGPAPEPDPGPNPEPDPEPDPEPTPEPAPEPNPNVDNVPDTADSLNADAFMGLMLMNLLALVACVILWRRRIQ